ncbi:MAG: hypothetical protein JWN85_554 [Gammaproteobacteria bacterium]|nr:hypothetical protein [Gammaproteobacteria bacterium]
MSPWTWLLVAIVALLAWWLLPAALGAAVPAAVSGRLYLRRLLKQGGVLALIPDECVRVLVADQVKMAETIVLMSQGQSNLKAEMVNGRVSVIGPPENRLKPKAAIVGKESRT